MNVKILATGLELIGKGIRGIEPVIEEIIRQANSEIHLMAYLVTPSAMKILRLLDEAAERGVKIRMVINNLGSQDATIVSALKSMSKKHPHVRIFNFNDPRGRQLHAKVIVVDRKKAVVGSANLSWGGMYSNYEIGLLVDGEPAWQLAAIIDFLAYESVRQDSQCT